MYIPVQVSRYEHGYTRPYARLVSRSMEHHGCAKLALIITDIVQMRIDYCNFEGMPMPVLAISYGSSSSSCRGQMELEERKGRKTRTTGAGEVRAGFKRLVGEPKSVGFEKGKCSAGVCVLLGESEMGWENWLAGWRHSPPVENRTELAC